MAEEKPTEAAAPADAAAGAPPKEEGAEGEAGEPKKKEHVVSIVLSYMNDEHEKAAIEVSRRTLSRQRRQPRSPDPDPRSSSLPRRERVYFFTKFRPSHSTPPAPRVSTDPASRPSNEPRR